jgi:hypothetical protein
MGLNKCEMPGVSRSLFGPNRLTPGKRIIKGRPNGVGFDRSHHYLQQGAPS